MLGQDGPLANREDALLAGLQVVGKARVPPGTVIRLTRTLLINQTPAWRDKRDYHCECRRPRPRRERTVRGRRLRGGVRREG